MPDPKYTQKQKREAQINTQTEAQEEKELNLSVMDIGSINDVYDEEDDEQEELRPQKAAGKSMWEKISGIGSFFHRSSIADKVMRAPNEDPGENNAPAKQKLKTVKIKDAYKFLAKPYASGSKEATVQWRGELKDFVEDDLEDLEDHSDDLKEVINAINELGDINLENPKSIFEKIEAEKRERALSKKIYRTLLPIKKAMQWKESVEKGWEISIDEVTKQEYEATLKRYSLADRKRLKEIADKMDRTFAGTMKGPNGKVTDLTDTDGIFQQAVYDDGRIKISSKNIEAVDRSGEPLFSHEPNISDIRQGDLGNCYFLGALTDLLEEDPAQIKECMKDMGDRVAVTFHNFGKPVTVIVKKTTYHDKRNDQGIGSKGDVLWVQMMEKAYGAVLGGYVNGADGKHQHMDRWQKEGSLLGGYPKGTDKNGNPRRMHLIRENPYNTLMQGGNPASCIAFMTGRDIGAEDKYSRDLRKFNRESISLSKLIDKAHDDMRSDFKKEHPGMTAREWNLYKARTIFGDNRANAQGDRYDIFRKNKLFDVFKREFKVLIERDYSTSKFSTLSDFLEAMDFIEDYLGNIPLQNKYFNSIEEQTAVAKTFLNQLKKYVSRNTKLVRHDHALTGEEAYTEKELAVFRELKAAKNAKKMITLNNFRDLPFAALKTNGDGGNGDRSVFHQGVAAKHNYTFLGVEEVPEQDGKRLFVVLRNPQADRVRIYKKNGRAYDVMNTTEKDETVQERVVDNKQIVAKSAHIDTDGVFRMELRDFLNLSTGYSKER